MNTQTIIGIILAVVLFIVRPFYEHWIKKDSTRMTFRYWINWGLKYFGILAFIFILGFFAFAGWQFCNSHFDGKKTSIDSSPAIKKDALKVCDTIHDTVRIEKEKIKYIPNIQQKPSSQSIDSLTVQFNKQTFFDSAVTIKLSLTNHVDDACNILEIFFSNGSIPIPALNPKTKEKIEPFLLEKNKPFYMECSFDLKPLANSKKVLGVDYDLVDTCIIGLWVKYPNDIKPRGITINHFNVLTRKGNVINFIPEILNSKQTDFYTK